jgi:hypothetical protein
VHVFCMHHHTVTLILIYDYSFLQLRHCLFLVYLRVFKEIRGDYPESKKTYFFYKAGFRWIRLKDPPPPHTHTQTSLYLRSSKLPGFEAPHMNSHVAVVGPTARKDSPWLSVEFQFYRMSPKGLAVGRVESFWSVAVSISPGLCV